MGAVPVSMMVTVYPKNKTDKPYPATIVGYAWITDLGVGGGPMPPGQGEHPDNTLPGDLPHPEHPIVLPPIEEPPPIDETPPPGPGAIKPFPEEGGWGYSDRTGWIYKPKDTEGRPKGGGRR